MEQIDKEITPATASALSTVRGFKVKLFAKTVGQNTNPLTYHVATCDWRTYQLSDSGNLLLLD
jgi:hypothetical protein